MPFEALAAPCLLNMIRTPPARLPAIASALKWRGIILGAGAQRMPDGRSISAG